MAEVQKEQNRAFKEGNKPENDQQQHSQAAVGGAPAEASGGDSSVGVEKVRARGPKGKFLADDPSTPENEAWVEKPKRKPAAKKKAAKKG
jgi:hypothetical protein